METKKNPVALDAAPEVGTLLKRFLTEKRTRKSVLARMLGTQPQTVQKYQAKTTMQTETLWKLSVLLKHNFFLDLADYLPKEFSTYSQTDTSLSEQMAALQKENEILKAQNAILLEALRR